jgi:hypothetical protein
MSQTYTNLRNYCTGGLPQSYCCHDAIYSHSHPKISQRPTKPPQMRSWVQKGKYGFLPFLRKTVFEQNVVRSIFQRLNCSDNFFFDELQRFL